MMWLYRSLVFRERKLARKRTLLMLILFLLVALLMLMPLLSGVSMEPGEAAPVEMILLLVGTVSLTGGAMAGGNNGVQKADISAGWKRYSFVLPPTAKQQAFADLLAKLCDVVLFGLLSAAVAMAYSVATGYDASGLMVNIYLGAVCVVMLVDVVYSYILMFAKTKQDLAIVGLIALVGVGLVMLVLDFLSNTIKLPDQPAQGGALISDAAFERFVTALSAGRTTLCVTAAFVVLCALYFLVMWRSHERREP